MLLHRVCTGSNRPFAGSFAHIYPDSIAHLDTDHYFDDYSFADAIPNAIENSADSYIHSNRNSDAFPYPNIYAQLAAYRYLHLYSDLHSNTHNAFAAISDFYADVYSHSHAFANHDKYQRARQSDTYPDANDNALSAALSQPLMPVEANSPAHPVLLQRRSFDAA